MKGSKEQTKHGRREHAAEGILSLVSSDIVSIVSHVFERGANATREDARLTDNGVEVIDRPFDKLRGVAARKCADVTAFVSGSQFMLSECLRICCVDRRNASQSYSSAEAPSKPGARANAVLC